MVRPRPDRSGCGAVSVRGIRSALGEAAQLRVRHVYLTLQDQFVVDELLEEDFEAVRNPFRVLFYDQGLSWLVQRGAATFNAYDAHLRHDPPGQLPFVPHLGALRLNAKAQVEHRALRHLRGFTTWEAEAIPSSPTGVRLIRREEELVSRYRLADTYESGINPKLSRRLSAEGNIDYFVCDDESTWHVALSVEPRQRISVEPLTEDAAEMLRSLRIAPRAYIHVYPHGGLTVTLGLSLIFRSQTPIGEAIRVIRMLVGRRAEPAFAFAMRGAASAPAGELVRRLAGMTISAIAPSAPQPETVHLDYAVSVGADADELSDAELSGLVTLDDRYEILRDRWVDARASLYGKYGGDRVVASRSSLAVATSPKHFAPSGRRRFFWRCHALKELAVLQELIVSSASRRLAGVGTSAGPDEATTQRLMAVAEHLIEFSRGLPAHHRKWFYECQTLVGGDSAVDRYYEVLGHLHQDARHAAMMRRMEESPRIRIDVTNSQIGTLNLGTIVGDVENHLSAIGGPEAEEGREALHRLAQAVIDQENLTDGSRRELLEQIDLLAEEAARPPERRRSAVARSILAGLAASLSAAGGLAEVWAAAGPTLVHFFGG